jgi:hypothetical protein
MQILKSTIFETRKCEFGNFEIHPDAGWKISQLYLDFESRLLVVRVSDTNENNWIENGTVHTIPTKQFIINTQTGNILTPVEWRQYFTYEPVESFSEDKKFKLITRRVYDRDSDNIHEELIHVETGKTISTSVGMAFLEEKRKNLLDQHYENLQRQQTYLKNMEQGEYPAAMKEKYWREVNDGAILLEYFNSVSVYQLVYDDQKIIVKLAEKPHTQDEWNNLKLEKIKSYSSIDEFWFYFTEDCSWFEKFNPKLVHQSIQYVIIKFYNNLISTNELTYCQHTALREWMNLCWNEEINRNVYWQFCSNCISRVFYNPRYPKHACGKCVALVTDELGNKIDFSNTHELKYIASKEQLFLKGTNEEVRIFIGIHEYWAEEARFGGIVYQKKEK